MTETKQTAHTPGPWIANGHAVEQDKPKDVYVICSIHGGRFEDDRTESELDSNARLIAAAPDLLAATEAMLKRIRTMKTWLPKSYPALAMVQLAEAESAWEGIIAKAKGE